MRPLQLKDVKRILGQYRTASGLPAKVERAVQRLHAPPVVGFAAPSADPFLVLHDMAVTARESRQPSAAAQERVMNRMPRISLDTLRSATGTRDRGLA